MTEQSDPNESNTYFSEESILNNHINEVHLYKKSYKCKKCKKTFSKKHFLKTHINSNHPKSKLSEINNITLIQNEILGRIWKEHKK